MLNGFGIQSVKRIFLKDLSMPTYTSTTSNNSKLYIIMNLVQIAKHKKANNVNVYLISKYLVEKTVDKGNK